MWPWAPPHTPTLKGRDVESHARRLSTVSALFKFRGSNDAISPFDDFLDNWQFPVVPLLGVVSNDDDFYDFRARCLLPSASSMLFS